MSVAVGSPNSAHSITSRGRNRFPPALSRWAAASAMNLWFVSTAASSWRSVSSTPARTRNSSAGSSKSTPKLKVDTAKLLRLGSAYECAGMLSEIQHRSRNDTECDRRDGRHGNDNRSQCARYGDSRTVADRLGEEHQHDDANIEVCGHRAQQHRDDDERPRAAPPRRGEDCPLADESGRQRNARKRHHEQREYAGQHWCFLPQSGPFRQVRCLTACIADERHDGERADRRESIGGQVEQDLSL